MPRVRTSLAGIVLVLVTPVMLSLSAASCSVFSGWSDLQEGNGADAGRDGSKSDGSGSGDGAAAEDGDTTIGTLPAVPCGSDTCTLGKGCCFVPGSGQSCTNKTQCTGTETFFGCVDRRSCVRFLGAAARCCFSSGGSPRGSACTLDACGAGQVELCDSTAALPCTAGTCTIDFGVNGVKACE